MANGITQESFSVKVIGVTITQWFKNGGKGNVVYITMDVLSVCCSFYPIVAALFSTNIIHFSALYLQAVSCLICTVYSYFCNPTPLVL